MPLQLKPPHYLAILLVLTGALLLLLQPQRLPGLDAKANAYFEESIKAAGIGYATVRVVNAGVSVIQESDLQLEPAGIGVSVAVGQVADPLNDMTERLSNVMVTAIVSLGVQKLLYEIALVTAPAAMAIILLLLAVLVCIRHPRTQQLRRLLAGAAVIVASARLFLPFSAILNDLLYDGFFAEPIAQAQGELSLASEQLNRLGAVELPEADGVRGTIENALTFIEIKAHEFRLTLSVLSEQMGGIISNLLALTWLYVGVFFIQVIALPLLIFYLLVKFTNAVIGTAFPELLRPHRSEWQPVASEKQQSTFS